MVKQRYKIWCLQRNQYFAEGVNFNNLIDVKEQLIDYHSVDSEEDLHKLSLSELLEMYEWEIHTEDGDIIIVDELQELVAEKVKRIKENKNEDSFK